MLMLSNISELSGLCVCILVTFLPLKLCQVEPSVNHYFQVSPEMIGWVQVRSLAEQLKDIHRVEGTLALCHCPVGWWTFYSSQVSEFSGPGFH